MGNSANTYYSVSIAFLLGYILLNGYNLDKSIREDGTDDIGVITKRLSNLPAVTKIVLMIIPAVVLSVLVLINKPVTIFTMITNILFFISACIIFVLSTINYNNHNNNSREKCKITQMTLINRKYYDNDKNNHKDRDSIFKDKDSSIGFRVLYLIGLVLLTISTIKDNSFDMLYVLLIGGYFISCLFVQLIPSFILRLYSDYMEWPSFFTYLDQYIQNNNDPRRYVFTIIGGIRMSLLLIVSMFLSYKLIVGKKKLSDITHGTLFLLIIVIWIVFILYLSFWQIAIGDGCIIERTLDNYKYDKKTDSIDLGKEFKYFKDALVCSIDNQFGLYFHLILLSLCLTIIGFRAK